MSKEQAKPQKKRKKNWLTSIAEFFLYLFDG